MRCRQPVFSIRTVDIEALRPIDALQMGKSLQWHLGCACDELQKLRLLRLVKRAHSSPPPLDHRITGLVALQLRVVLPFVHINVW